MNNKYKIGILATHPIQYYARWYQELAKRPDVELKVFYCHRQSPGDQAKAGFGVEFNWDVPLLEGYGYQFLNNKARRPGIYTFFGCDTPEIKEVIHKDAFDAFIVHGWNVKSFWQAMSACWHSRTPVLVRGDSQLPMQPFVIMRWLKYPFYRRFITKFDAYLAVGKRNMEYYRYYGADDNKIFFVPHSVDNDFFASRCAELAPEREQLRKGWKIQKDSTVFIFAGKLISKKRPYDFLKALRLAYKDVTRIHGLVVGDGPLRHRLEALARRDNLPVTFAGFLNQSEIAKAYIASDALVLPSDGRETWGLVVNEAMACGLGAIVSDQTGCAPDLIHSGETGEIFRCRDIEKLADCLKSFAQQEYKLREMGRNAQKVIVRYSIANTVEGTIKAVRAVCRHTKI